MKKVLLVFLVLVLTSCNKTTNNERFDFDYNPGDQYQVSLSDFVDAYAARKESFNDETYESGFLPEKVNLTYSVSPALHYQEKVTSTSELTTVEYVNHGKLDVEISYHSPQGTTYVGEIVNAKYEGKKADTRDPYINELVGTYHPYNAWLYGLTNLGTLRILNVFILSTNGSTYFYKEHSNDNLFSRNTEKEILQDETFTYYLDQDGNKHLVGKFSLVEHRFPGQVKYYVSDEEFVISLKTTYVEGEKEYPISMLYVFNSKCFLSRFGYQTEDEDGKKMTEIIKYSFE